MHYPVAERRGGNQPTFRVTDVEGIIGAGPVAPVPQLALEFQQLIFALEFEGGDPRLTMLAAGRLAKGGEQVIEAREERVDPYWLDLVALRDISDLGLRGYLRQGYEVPQRTSSTRWISRPARTTS